MQIEQEEVQTRLDHAKKILQVELKNFKKKIIADFFKIVKQFHE